MKGPLCAHRGTKVGNGAEPTFVPDQPQDESLDDASAHYGTTDGEGNEPSFEQDEVRAVLQEMVAEFGPDVMETAGRGISGGEQYLVASELG